MARLLNSEQPFYGLSAWGSENGQVPRIEDIAAHYINEIRTIQLNGPYFIGGSGWGCPIVLEMAHQLESQGQDIGLIALLTPSPIKPNVSNTNVNTHGRLLRYGKLLRHYFRLLIIHLSSRALIPALYNAFSNRVLWHFRLFRRFIPIEIHRYRRFLDAFSKARRSYEPKPYQGQITCFLREEYSHDPKRRLGDWYDMAVGGLDVQFVPGNYFTTWQEPHVQVLADQLQVCLDKAQTDMVSQRKQSTPTDAADAEIGQNAFATARVSNQN